MGLSLGGKTPESIYINNKEVSSISINNDVVWLKELTPDYFYIENTSNNSNTISIGLYTMGTVSSGVYATQLEFSKDKENWTTINLMNLGYSYNISLNVGEKVYFRNDSGYFNYYGYSGGYVARCYQFTGNYSHIAGGDIRTILDYRNVNTVNTKQGCFARLFYGNSRLTKGPEYPFDTLNGYTFFETYRNCSNLTQVPLLPAKHLGDREYQYMFHSCSSLTTVGNMVLPSENTTIGCYSYMFYNCVNLEDTPIIYAKSLSASYVCQYMFYGCSKVDSLTVYMDSVTGNNATASWLGSVSATGTFHNLGTATYSSGISGIPSGWTEVNN